MDHRISSDQYRTQAVGLLKSAIEAPADQKEGFIRDALLYLTSAGSRDQGSPADADDGRELGSQEAETQVLQLIKQALDAPTPEELSSFLDFANSFRRLSAWNAYMAYIQRPGARVIASEYEWKRLGRVVKADAIPIIILWPRSPIRFVYELADIGPEIDRRALNDPFSVEGKLHPKAIAALKTSLTKQKAFRIEIEWRRYGFEYAGSAAQQGTVPAEESPSGPMRNGSRIAEFARGNAATERREPERLAKDNVVRYIPSYRVTVNDRLEEGERFATIAHELGHIFCGHLGGCNSARMDDEGGWPDRSSLGKHEQEIEAEAIAYVVCSRGGIIPASAQYLKKHAALADIANVNLDLVVRAAARVERLAKIRHGSVVFQDKKRP